MARSDQSGKSAGGFLDRWARRKAEAQRPPSATAASATIPAEPAPELLPEPPPALTEAEIAALPPIDSLGPDSDYAPFLRPGVPLALRRQALARAWRTDPVISTFRGLNDYDEDFNAPHFTQNLLKTVWEFGKGMPDPQPVKPPPLQEDVQGTEAAEAQGEAQGETPAPSAPAAPNPPENPPVYLAADPLPVAADPPAQDQVSQPVPIQKIRRGGAAPQ